MAKIALVSDVHLGTRQYGLKERYHDFHRSFERFCNDVLRSGVEGVVIGGDLFDSPRPDAGSVLVAQDVVRKITKAKIEVCGIDGNHDMSDGGWLKAVGAQSHLELFPVNFCGASMLRVNYRSGRDFVDALSRVADSGEKAEILVAHFALAEMNGGGSADTGVQELSPILDKLGVR